MILATISEFIGRFHPLFVHLPIGILLIGLLFHWLSKLEKFKHLGSAVPLLMFFGAISAAFSCLSGYLLSKGGEYDGSTLDWHMWMGIGVLILAVILCFKTSKDLSATFYTILGVGLFVLISVTGHLGGSLTHGEDYLSSPFLSKSNEEEIKKIIPDVQKAVAYGDIVQPILQSKCYSCHGPNKQKGKFRMDSFEDLIKGGKQGEAILAGDVEQSELMRRILLPKEDKKHMAPSGKTQLSEDEIALLHWWIEKGADEKQLVAQMEQSEKIKPLLLALQSDGQENISLPIIPQQEIGPANQNAIQKLTDAGILVMPVAQNSNYLMANFVMVPQATDEQVELLKEIKEHLIWLKIGETKITDEALSVIGTCTNLIQLQLNHTSVSDKGMAFLKNLLQLQSISLVGTKITDNGLRSLSGLKNLQTIYLYQSAVDKNQIPALSKLFAKAKLDTGGYIVPTLASDTIVVK